MQKTRVVHPIADGQRVLTAVGLFSKYRSPPPLASSPDRAREIFGSDGPASYIVKEDLGTGLAQQVLRSLATPPRPASRASLELHGGRQLDEKNKVPTLRLDTNVAHSISIDNTAEVAAMSKRNFLRRFKSEVGMTPSDYLLHVRLNLCMPNAGGIKLTDR